MGESAMRLGGIRRSNAAEITIRLTQQGMAISLRLFPFPTVLITIYRLRRIPICNSLHTAGNGNFASLIPIPYCANHDLPSPTDWLGEDYVVARVDYVRLLESVSTEEVFKTDAITLSDNTHRFTLFHLVRLRSPRRHLLIFLL